MPPGARTAGAGQSFDEHASATTSRSTSWALTRSPSSRAASTLGYAEMPKIAEDVKDVRAASPTSSSAAVLNARARWATSSVRRRDFGTVLRHWAQARPHRLRQRKRGHPRGAFWLASKAIMAQIPLTGINVRRPRAEQEGNVHKLVGETATLLGIDTPESVKACGRWMSGWDRAIRCRPTRWWRRGAAAVAARRRAARSGLHRQGDGGLDRPGRAR